MVKQQSPGSPSEIIESVSLEELCRLCAVREDWIIELVEEGILEPGGTDAAAWQFSSVSITKTQIAWRLHQDLGVNQAGIAVALNLLDEKEKLRQRLNLIERTIED